MSSESESIELLNLATTVFLDRVGVITEKMPEGQYVSSVSEFHLLPGVPEEIARVRATVECIDTLLQRN